MMFDKKKMLRFLAEKKEIFGSIPEEVLSADKIEEIRQIPVVAVGDIRNGDHVLAALKVLSKKRPDAYLPVLSYSGSEYGDWGGLGKYLKQVKSKIEKHLKIYVLDPVIVGAPSFFRSLNTSYAADIRKKFGFHSPCLGCRLYSLAVRIPLCRKINARIIISGDVLKKRDEQEIRKTYENYKNCSTLMKGFGIELWDAAVTFEEADGVLDKLNMKNRPDDVFKLNCVMNRACLSDRSFIGDPKQARKYYEDFAIPAAAKILSRVFSGADVDYEKEVSEIIVSRGA